MSRPRILLADDHVALAKALAGVVEGEFELVGMVHDGGSLLKAAREFRPEVIVADISMPVLNGLEVLRQLKREGTTAKIVLTTANEDPQLAAVALLEGASGYVLKHSAGEELITAIHEAIKGSIYVTPRLMKDNRLATDRNSWIKVAR